MVIKKSFTLCWFTLFNIYVNLFLNLMIEILYLTKNSQG